MNQKKLNIHGPDSLNHMYIAGRIASKALDKVELMLKENPYRSTLEIDKLCHDFIIAQGGIPECVGYKAVGAPPYEHTTCTSKNDVACHGIPSDEVLEEGDIINVDLVVNYNGWLGDTSRTFIIGKTTKSREKLVLESKRAMYVGMKSVVLGAEFRTIGRAIENYCDQIEIEGQPISILPEYCGHGISQYMHELPLVEHKKNNCKVKIMPYLYFTIEPIITLGNQVETCLQSDRWTVKTKSGAETAQFEHTMGLDSEGKLHIFTTTDDQHEAQVLQEMRSL
jgi:methionyl aminopeptidase